MASQLTRFARQSSDGYEMRRCQECGLEWASPMKAPNADWYELAYLYVICATGKLLCSR
jgi:hypothetical protein